MLDAAKIKYEIMEYVPDENDLTGTHIAEQIGLDPDMVFKTLVAKGDKNGISVFLFNWEIVADGRLCFNCSATFDDPALEEHGFHEGSLTRATATHEGNVLNLVSLINFSHNVFSFRC